MSTKAIYGHIYNLAVMEYILKEAKTELTREGYCFIIFHHFKVVLNKEVLFQRLQLSYAYETSSYATVLRWFREFRRGQNSRLYEEHARRLCNCSDCST